MGGQVRFCRDRGRRRASVRRRAPAVANSTVHAYSICRQT
ncbi:hypothetical protein BRPE64_BCDS10290 [Caballeronia insecticola]|uniref:Uncharacterized protein n=1 Tax=Caballeronia insecticola TaxID=758793 RepID=R4WX51_9BURK|nr:hypothetical protein BRPE64_BCDS10290 [Caballeronia insecticola]